MLYATTVAHHWLSTGNAFHSSLTRSYINQSINQSVSPKYLSFFKYQRAASAACSAAAFFVKCGAPKNSNIVLGASSISNTTLYVNLQKDWTIFRLPAFKNIPRLEGLTSLNGLVLPHSCSQMKGDSNGLWHKLHTDEILPLFSPTDLKRPPCITKEFNA